MLGRRGILLIWCALVHFAACAPFYRHSRNGLQARDVIVNVGDVTTVKKVISTAVPTTIYVPYTVSGEVTTVASVSTAIQEVTLISTATAVSTKLIRTVVTEGVTQTAILTTTAFNVQINPVAFITGPAVTVYQPSTVVQTVQGVPVTSVMTVIQNKAAEASSREGEPTQTREHDADKAEKSRDDSAADTHTQSSTPAWIASGLSPSSVATVATGMPGARDSLDANNTAEADGESGATVDSSNVNTNNVTVVSAGPIQDTKNWLEENKWIAIGVGCAIILLVIVGIVAIVIGGKSHGASGPPAQQSVVLSAPGAAPAMRAQPVQNSLARPSRRRYARVGGDGSSAMSSSSGAEDLKQRSKGLRSGSSSAAVGARRSARRD